MTERTAAICELTEKIKHTRNAGEALRLSRELREQTQRHVREVQMSQEAKRPGSR